MKHYPEMASTIQRDIDVYFFEKLDGSNIRAEWSPKRGFYKFGTRKRLLGEDDPMFGEAIGLIRAQEDKLSRIFRTFKPENLISYFEFFGENSFAGLHEAEPHKTVLLDVDIFKQGFLTPNQFIRSFENEVEIPKFIHHGKANHEVEQCIREGRFPGASFEGVVCKSTPPKKWALPILFKIKNQAWIDKVKERYGSRKDLEDLL